VALTVYGATFRSSFRDQIVAQGQDPADYKDDLNNESTKGAMVMGIGGSFTFLLGAAGVTAGIAMLVKSKRLASSSSSTHAWLPHIAPGYSGLVFLGQF